MEIEGFFFFFFIEKMKDFKDHVQNLYVRLTASNQFALIALNKFIIIF